METYAAPRVAQQVDTVALRALEANLPLAPVRVGATGYHQPYAPWFAEVRHRTSLPHQHRAGLPPTGLQTGGYRTCQRDPVARAWKSLQERHPAPRLQQTPHLAARIFSRMRGIVNVVVSIFALYVVILLPQFLFS